MGGPTSRHPPTLGFVARDLEGIFGAPTSSRRVEPVRTAPSPNEAPPPRQGRRGNAVMGGVLAVVASGALAAFVLNGAPTDPVRTGSGPTAPGAGVTVELRQPSPGPGAMEPDPGTAVAGDIGDLASLPPPLAPSQAGDVGAPPSLPASPSQSTRAGPIRVALPQRDRVVLRTALPARSAALEYGCDGDSGYERAQCEHQTVMRADRRLRRAYANARNSGVSSQVLARYNSRWSNLLDDAEASPRQVASGYLAMANKLDRLTSDAAEARSDDGPE